MVTFVGIPLGGLCRLAGHRPGGHPAASLLGGLVTGAVLGAVQAWGLGGNRPPVAAWIVATTLGLMAGLGLGAAIVDYDTSLSALVTQGAVTGLAVGVAQGIVLLPRLGRVALAWPPSSPSSGRQGGRPPPPPGSMSTSSSPSSAPAAHSPSPPSPSSSPRPQPHQGDHPMSTTTTRRLAAAAMTWAALLAIAGFTALGSVFDYPQILQEPTDDILALYREHQTAVSGWFLVLVISAAMLAPAGRPPRPAHRRPPRPLDRRGRHRRRHRPGRRPVPLGAVRPRLSPTRPCPTQRRRAAHFELLHTWLGAVLGETIGYALTATFTVLVVIGLSRGGASRWLIWLGYASAALIATGVVIPLGVEAPTSPTSPATSPGACG